MANNNSKFKIQNSRLITLAFILLIAGLTCYTWNNYRRNNPPYSPEINEVLFMAGDNRSELEKVLKHYSRNPADSLKLRAAEFLIANMPGKYSLEYEAPFENVVAVYMRWDDIGDRQAVNEAHGLDKETVREDVKYITGDYLINNIELSFRVWHEQPWGKDVPFDVFCEEILPYRVAFEPLENWREKILSTYTGHNSFFSEHPETTSTEACIRINSQLPRLKLMGRMPKMNYSMIMTTTKGMCDEMSALAIFVTRALGIPVSQDFTLTWPWRNVGHTWNSVYDCGKRISFMGTEASPGVSHHGSRISSGKVYRRTYANMKNIDAGDADIPPVLRQQNMKDVTCEYVPLPSHTDSDKPIRPFDAVLQPYSEGQNGLKIPLRYPSSNSTGYAYFAIAGENTWNMAGWGRIDSGTADFGTVGRRTLCLPVYYENSQQIPASYPFILDSIGKLRIFEPDENDYRKLSVSTIFSDEDKFKDRMLNGVFEGANKSDFSDAVRLYTVHEASGEHFSTATVRNPSRFRYVRYVSPANSHCHVAEMEFYNDRGERLRGKPEGTPGSYQDSDMTLDKVFDGDVSTFYDAMFPSNSWVGLDLGEPQTISKIRYLPHNSGNGIYEGHIYELFCWKDKNWQSLERQKAKTFPLFFQAPTNALLYFKNVTANKSSKYFVLNKNGEQEWM
ncbi:MAG: discoidin domain-containing protein [Prevotellaceae bacterium]|jgi:hypothetical protein|nr:discoidin domain-containing protein [Prevotellaceae bacterium]